MHERRGVAGSFCLQPQEALKDITPYRSFISCKAHSGHNHTDQQCVGGCHRILPMEKFSKNSRRMRKYKCIDCTQHQLYLEPHAAVPAPNTLLDTAEKEALAQCLSVCLMLSAPDGPRDHRSSEVKLCEAGACTNRNFPVLKTRLPTTEHGIHQLISSVGSCLSTSYNIFRQGEDPRSSSRSEMG
ncbi:hypothetical protein QBC45DRAFT_242280 [Copromyces sp. CBS 386.78]|nr:hypothetical protein QBC45DRAFT_242280 [Copromyces sp. CBS 386.78]